MDISITYLCAFVRDYGCVAFLSWPMPMAELCQNLLRIEKLDVFGQAGSNLPLPLCVGIDSGDTAPYGIMEYFGICVVFPVQGFFPEEFPKPFDDVEVRGIGR